MTTQNSNRAKKGNSRSYQKDKDNTRAQIIAARAHDVKARAHTTAGVRHSESMFNNKSKNLTLRLKKIPPLQGSGDDSMSPRPPLRSDLGYGIPALRA